LDTSIILQALVTFGAVVLGFMLSHLSEAKKAKKSEQIKRTNIQRLLRLETEENVLALKKYWERILNADESWLDKNNEFKYGTLAKVISENPFPVLSTSVWHSNLSELPAYMDYGRIEKLWIFYQRVERLKAIYVFLCEANTDRKTNIQSEKSRIGGVAHFLAGSEFAGIAYDHSKKFKSLIETVLTFHINA